MLKNNFKTVSALLSILALTNFGPGQERIALAQEGPVQEVAVKRPQGDNKEGLALMVDGKALCGLESKAEYDKLINMIINKYTSLHLGNKLENYSISPSLSTSPLGGSLKEGLKAEEALNLLVNGGQRQIIYRPEKGQDLASIGEKFSMTQEEIAKLNPGVDLSSLDGKEMNVLEKAPRIKVETRERTSWLEEVPFEVEYREDPSLFKDQTQVYIQGKPGRKRITSIVDKVDGQIVSFHYEEERVLDQPVKGVVLRGTKEKPVQESFINPAQGRLTSKFGPRWGRMHQGIDVANSVGTPIIASSGGRVVQAGWAGTYGNLVIIDHGNGLSTRYAHLSSISVQAGQDLSQGQELGKMGSTGRSTGSHLHFEVRVNGQATNPLNYVNY